MAKNLWNLGVAILLFAMLILVILFIYSLKWGSLEVKITLGVGILATIITVAISLISNYKEIKREELMKIKEGLELILYQHIQADEERYREHKDYDRDRYEEVSQLLEKMSKTINKIDLWIMEGKIKVA